MSSGVCPTGGQEWPRPYDPDEQPTGRTDQRVALAQQWLHAFDRQTDDQAGMLLDLIATFEAMTPAEQIIYVQAFTAPGVQRG